MRLFFANGGTEALVVRVGDGEPADPLGDPDAATGIYALDSVDFNLLNLAPAEPALAASVLAEAARLCRERRAVLIAEPPPAGGPQAAADFAAELAAAAGEAAADAMLYFRRLLSSATGRRPWLRAGRSPG